VALYTAALHESYAKGYRFKKHGHPQKFDTKTCWVCLEPPTRYNAANSFNFPPVDKWFQAMQRYGSSPMHAKPKAMECLINGAMAMVLAKQLRRGQGKHYKYSKAYLASQKKLIKLAIQQQFVVRCRGLRINFPDKKVPIYSFNHLVV
jgi:hypothetical protein